MKPAKAIATPNIALIKYWGNRNDELRLPMADSLSMTIDHPSVEISIEPSDSFSVRSWNSEGKEKQLGKDDIARFARVIDLADNYLSGLAGKELLPSEISIEVRSHIPPKIGLASSAAVFCCLAEALAASVTDEFPLDAVQKSVIARIGSGSAARSVHGGFVALKAGEGSSLASSYAEQIADEHHWALHDIILVPSHDEKKVGSTEGHALAHTSPLYAKRIEAIRNYRQRDCIDAILKRDFEKLRFIAEEDCLDMHEVMRTSTPSLEYLTEDTHRIIADVERLRTREHLPVLYTMDAGPTVHLFCTDESRDRILDYANAQTSCTVFETVVGPGSSVLS